MLWNYRGYGSSKGTANPTNIKADSEALIKYMRERMKLKGKLGVYGRSLGGVVTSHLCDQVDMVMSDRTFSNFEVASERKFYHRFAKYLFKMGSWGWVLNNDLNLLYKGSNNSCYKVILTDKNDEMVEVHSSLMTGMTREVL